jgi:hypothetical protein
MVKGQTMMERLYQGRKKTCEVAKNRDASSRQVSDEYVNETQYPSA